MTNITMFDCHNGQFSGGADLCSGHPLDCAQGWLTLLLNGTQQVMQLSRVVYDVSSNPNSDPPIQGLKHCARADDVCDLLVSTVKSFGDGAVGSSVCGASSSVWRDARYGLTFTGVSDGFCNAIKNQLVPRLESDCFTFKTTLADAAIGAIIAAAIVAFALGVYCLYKTKCGTTVCDRNSALGRRLPSFMRH